MIFSNGNLESIVKDYLINSGNKNKYAYRLFIN